ncbi:hypothetical protein FDENT_7805 [Fusarium denticulatum]|uniref:Uncharacterized protein n=1 Tax=Fusarium denticulatum TaxID=48507 RepID=A0A8H5U6Y1_9HYPO|nr:hypothetical protein FDENT_7805 [Fusarium denticulatum]
MLLSQPFSQVLVLSLQLTEPGLKGLWTHSVDSFRLSGILYRQAGLAASHGIAKIVGFIDYIGVPWLRNQVFSEPDEAESNIIDETYIEIHSNEKISILSISARLLPQTDFNSLPSPTFAKEDLGLVIYDLPYFSSSWTVAGTKSCTLGAGFTKGYECIRSGDINKRLEKNSIINDAINVYRDVDSDSEGEVRPLASHSAHHCRRHSTRPESSSAIFLVVQNNP